jgi:LmbE family N-acetylglucosaminyl deacetylase
LENSAVFFAPHPDDETLGCGGTIAQKITQGYEVSVVFLTDGRNALRDIGIFKPSPSKLKEVRKAEAIRAAKIIGINQENLFFLEIEDGKLSKNQSTAVEKISEILEARPREVYIPQEKEYNIDHRVTNSLVKTVIEKLEFSPSEYYYSIAWRYPLNLIIRFRPKHMQSLIMGKLLHSHVVRIDISASLPLKKAALDAYKSQTSLISDQQKAPLLKETFLKNFLEKEEEFFVPRPVIQKDD